MFDDRSFSTSSFDARSWLFGVAAAVRREVVRLASAIARAVTLSSRV